MSPKEALIVARAVKSGGVVPTKARICEALVALLDHGDSVTIPDFNTSVCMVGAHLESQGENYIEIAIDPETKEVGWSFTPTRLDETRKTFRN